MLTKLLTKQNHHYLYLAFKTLEKVIDINVCILHGNIDQTLVNSLHCRLNFEIGILDCHVITTEYKTHVH